jgi:hypothetical protein
MSDVETMTYRSRKRFVALLLQRWEDEREAFGRK